MQFPDLTPILSPVPWAVAGAVATRLYMPERATRDMDVVVLKQHRPEAERRLAGAGFLRQGELAIGGSSWLSPDGVPVDVMDIDEPWAAKALAQARENLDPQGLPVLPLPYLVLMKLQAGRVQDLADVTRMLGQADEGNLEATRQLFERYLPEDLDDLESLIALGRLEMRNQ